MAVLRDRGQVSSAERRPTRVLAYVQAGATLWDHGIRPTGIFGSGHDDPAVPDTAKTGSLPLAEVAYADAGATLDVETLLSGEPDLVVAVSYGGGQVYGLAPETAKHLEEHVPVVVIDVGQARTLAETGDRFARLARSPGRRGAPAAARELDAARDRLRTFAAGPDRTRVLALSPAGQQQAHLARWPTRWRPRCTDPCRRAPMRPYGRVRSRGTPRFARLAGSVRAGTRTSPGAGHAAGQAPFLPSRRLP